MNRIGIPNELDTFQTWLEMNRMKLKKEKCKIL